MSDFADASASAELSGDAKRARLDATATSTTHSFTALTYNILARSLGSNTIPWCIAIDAAFRERVEAATSTKWSAFKSATLTPEYKAHFHKNFAAGEYTAMRAFWAARKCASAADLPASLPHLRFVAEDTVAYTADGAERVATTLRGLLRQNLPESLALELFSHIVAAEEAVYAWAVRGPRLFSEVTRPRFGGGPPDIVALQEYDAHEAVARYRGDADETFAAAMDAAGWTGALFKDPKGGPQASGLGVFWRRAAFVAAADGGGEFEGGEIECDAGGGAFGVPARSVDMREAWHPLGGADDDGPTPMALSDRRNAALVRLTHRASGAIVWVCAAHLMTTSRDGARTNRYPGEVRAGEFVALRELVASEVRGGGGGGDQSGAAMLLMGDFNTPPGDAAVFEGRPPAAAAGLPPPPRLATGFSGGAFGWADADGAPLELRDAFEGIHRWGDAPAPGHCTSRNADRTEWIDYVFHTPATLTPTARSDTAAPDAAMPSETHPSDHLPLAVAFELRTRRV